MNCNLGFIHYDRFNMVEIKISWGSGVVVPMEGPLAYRDEYVLTNGEPGANAHITEYCGLGC